MVDSFVSIRLRILEISFTGLGAEKIVAPSKSAFNSFVAGAADVFLETERKDYHMFSPEERQRAV
ncbi:hypothetical protein LKD21_08365, partial [Bifidobacterium sp. CLA-AA-H280]|nr:hypothetical protein [Bifidobacterium adolescentis]